MTKRSTQGRALYYSRDSGGRHEMTPGQYVGWAMRRARDLGVTFDGSPEKIEAMIREGVSRSGDLFLDYGVSGNVLARDGLDALLHEAAADPTVSHVLVPRRDRLARPDDPLDGIKLEFSLRHQGICVVFMERVCPPFEVGIRRDLGETILALVDYDKSGKDRRDLAEKMIYAQLRLATLGYSVGGRPPYGFRRWLVKEDGTRVRELQDGERVRMPHHHVVWLPGPASEIAVIRRIPEMLETMPASRVAAILTEEGIPTPDHGRLRTDGGIKHLTSGVWRQSVVISVARNPLNIALVAYGRRSMGDQLRLGANGPRALTEADYRSDGVPKIVRNPADAIILTPTPSPFDPIISPERHRRLLDTLDACGSTQRGKPRSREPGRNPLGCRIFDMNCGWPMYRAPYVESFRYTCGLYQQTHGAQCSHNHVDGPRAVRFLLGCVRQRLLDPIVLRKLETRLNKIAKAEVRPDRHAGTHSKQATLNALNSQLETVARNMALAETPAQMKAIAATFEELTEKQRRIAAELQSQQPTDRESADPQAQVAAAMALVHRLTDLATDETNYPAIGQLFTCVNARLFVGPKGTAEEANVE
jgi:hypothetical protein